VVIDPTITPGKASGRPIGTIFTSLLTYRPQLNLVRDSEKRRFASAILNVV